MQLVAGVARLQDASLALPRILANPATSFAATHQMADGLLPLKGRFMDPLQLFHNLINLAAVDQKFTDEEIDYLIGVANRHDIPSEEFETALHGVREGIIEVTLPSDPEDRQKLLREMIRLMAADGELDEMEMRLCATASARMDFTTQQFNELLDDVINRRGAEG